MKWGNNRLRVALALDNTGSMASDGKIGALKTATKNLLDQLKAAADQQRRRLCVDRSVQQERERRQRATTHANWIDWDDWDDDNGHDTAPRPARRQKTGKSGKSKKKCTTTTTWVPDNHNTWNGCITDRDKDYDVDRHRAVDRHRRARCSRPSSTTSARWR